MAKDIYECETQEFELSDFVSLMNMDTDEQVEAVREGEVWIVI